MSHEISEPAVRGLSDVVVTFEHVSRDFGDVTALDRLSFEIKHGETVALLGPNGAGKTTATEVSGTSRWVPD